MITGIPRSQKDLEPKKIQHECRPREATHDIYTYIYIYICIIHMLPYPIIHIWSFHGSCPHLFMYISVYIHIYPIYICISHLYPQTLSPGIFLVQLIHISFACGLEMYHQR